MRMTFTVPAEQGIVLVGAGRAVLTFKGHTLWLRELSREGDTMTLTFEEPWSVDA